MHNHCRRNVAVEHATARATVYTPRELLLADGHASRTGLGGGLRVDCNELTTSILSFVCEHRGQLAPRSVRDVPRHVRLGQKIFNVQFRHRDPAEAANEAAGNFVQVITPLIGDALMQPSERQSPLGLVIGATLATDKRPLPPTHFPFGAFRPVRALDPISIRERNEASGSKIDANAYGSVGDCGTGDLDVKDDVPLATFAASGLRIWRRSADPGASAP